MELTKSVEQTNSNIQLYHGITFMKLDTNGRYTNSTDSTKHSWNDFSLIPTSRPVIAQPQYVQKYVDIPGMDGSLDLSDYLTGHPNYSDRSGALEFYVINPNPQSWEEKRSNIAAFFNGMKMLVILDDDRSYCYTGRVVFKDWKSEAKISKITLEYRLGPYKYKYETNPSDPTLFILKEGAL